MSTPTDQRPPADVNDFLMGNGDGPSAPFLKMGPPTQTRPAHNPPNDFKGGRILALRPVQAAKLGPIDRQTGKPTRVPQFYVTGQKAGQPIWNALVTLQTQENDPSIEGGDDGVRQVEVGGFDRYWEATADADCLKRAVRLAVTASGATGLAVGGELHMAWVRQVNVGASNLATHWVARYVPPGQTFEFDQAAPAQQQYQPAPVQQQQQYQPAPVQQTHPYGASVGQPPAYQPAPQGYQQPPVQPAPYQAPPAQQRPAEPPF